MWSRRDFLKISGASFVSSLALGAHQSLAKSEQIFAGCCKFRDGQYGFALLSSDGDLISTATLPSRGHDVVQCPNTGKFVAFARRPGVFAAIFDKGGKPLGSITSPKDRHFYGHGVFSHDGRFLFATENDFENARGIIGIYRIGETQTDRVGEFFSGGIGPHDICISEDGTQLIIVNGGIETHPDYARTKLNLASMKSNISMVDITHGDLKQSFGLPAKLHQLSLRHVAKSKDTIWIGSQFQGQQDPNVPLVAKLSARNGLELIQLDPELNRKLNGYVGSIEVSAVGDRIALSSPKGNHVLVIDQDGNHLHSHNINDVCALAPNVDNSFQVGTGAGSFGTVSQNLNQVDGFSFDNHMISTA